MISIPGYKIRGNLHQGSGFILYRGEREKGGAPVIIKLAAEEYPPPQSLSQLRHEYKIAKDLNINGIIRPCALEEYDKGLALILEDMEGQSLKNFLASRVNLEEFLVMAISLTQTLCDLHRNNIIHKDINPYNILINPDKGEVKLTGLSIASILPRENPSITSPRIIEGTLPYISPEQTGRMNRCIDYRSDFYSLGMTFYETLTGSLPFEASDPLELVHCHMAKEPVPPHEIDPEIPKTVSAIAMRLIAKTPEERYQSARGLKADLEECLRRLRATGRIEDFPIGRYDISEAFQIPQKLCGREREIQILLREFEQVTEGKTTMLMVSGYTGIGKTSLVQEIYRSIAQKGGYFISGEFDRFHRNVPYSAWVRAFQDLVRQLLTESERELNRWKKRLLTALGPNGKIIIDVIPEVGLVIGPQPPVQELGPVESQNRFRMVFQNFIRVFCKREHPLVIFLDNLHWVDTATLKLIDLIMTDRKTQYLFLIGAYRDNEMHPSHPLLSTLEILRKKSCHVNEISLGPLSLKDTTQLLANTLHSDRESVRSLAELVVRKTGGNPFFLKQFLETLYEEKLFEFDVLKGCWQWEIAQIKKSEMTDNVGDLIAMKIRKLPEKIQNILKLAACIGNKFDLKTLTIVNEKSARETADDLWPAIQEGLILPISNFEFPISDFEESASISHLGSEPANPVFKFLHDRVQQAAYSLIQSRHKKEVHLKVGRLMLANSRRGELNEKVFNILNHLNFAGDLITGEKEKEELAKLNLMAGTKAKMSTAYEPALKYLTAGMQLLGEGSWQNQYELTFKLHKQRAEAEYLNGNFEQSEKLIDLTLTHARSAVEKAEVYSVLIVQYTMRARYAEAYEVGRKALSLLDIRLPEIDQTDIQDMLDRQVAEVKDKIGDKAIASLIDAPELAIPEKKMAVELLADMLPLAYFLDLPLFSYLTATLVSISLQHGYVPVCSYGFVCYGRLLISRGEYKSGYEFGLLSMRLSEKFNDLGQKCRCYNSFANYVHCWGRHIKWADPLNREGYQAGLQSGELQFAGYCLCNALFNQFYQGINLERIKELCSKYQQFLLKTRNQIANGVVATVRWAALNLSSHRGGEYDSANHAFGRDTQFEERLQTKASTLVFCHYQAYMGQVLYLYGKPDHALQPIQKAEKVLTYVVGSVVFATHNFYYSLILAALYPGASEKMQRSYLKQLELNQRQMKIWADSCEDNFLHKYLLVAAETARITGKDFKAIDLYDRAIESAKKNEFIQDEALANELAAKFWLLKGKEAFAEPYMRKAQYAYQLWGAEGKVRDLEENYPHLLAKKRIESQMTEGTSSDVLDLSTMMKASQAISSEIVLDKLLAKLIKILIENAGAQTGLLILVSNGRLLIEADGAIDRDEAAVLQSVSIEKAGSLSPAIVKYVARAHEYVVLSNAAQEGMFASDPYVKSHGTKSVVCGPILHKSKLSGIFYLENMLISGAFTAQRLEVLKLLASQIAISIENARLYSNLESQSEKIKATNLQLNREIEERKRAEEKYRDIFENAVEGIYQTTPEGRFITANPAMAQMFGFDSPEELMKTVTDIKHQLYVNPERRSEFISSMRDHQTVSGFEVEFYRKDGSKFWASIHARSVFDENDELLFLEGIVTDISESKREAEALREREEYLRKENIRLRSNIRDRYKFGDIVGKSLAMQEVYDLILKAAATDVNAIIYGESGTGKELVARAIHDMSDRKDKAIVAINCGAIPENLFESEFFGYKKGAFTGAYTDRRGYLDQADGGTLFLDELGEIPLNMQVKLLRVLEGHGYTPVGGCEVNKTNVRIIASTHRDLQDHVRKGLLREDFFYRIHIIPIHIPPLRKRKEDIPLLIEHFQKAFENDGKSPAIPGRITEAMLNYDWPGNVRELQNTLQRYLMLGKLDFMGAPLQQSEKMNGNLYEEIGGDTRDLRTAMENFEKNYILSALKQNQWQRTKAASILGINRKTLFKKMKYYGVNRPHNGDK